MFGNQLLDSHSASSTITSIGGIPTGLTPGSVVFIGPTTVLAEDNTNLFWNDTLNRLGILTDAPTDTLDVGAGGTVRVRDFTAGSVVFAGTSGVLSQDNTNLFWDDTDNELGVGVSGSSILAKLHVRAGASGGVPAFASDTVSIFQRNAAAGLGPAVVLLGGTVGTSSLRFASTTTTDSGAITYGYSADVMAFFTATLPRAALDASGLLVTNNVIVTAARLHAEDPTTDILRADSGANELFSVGQLETVVNEAGLSTHDFRIESDTQTHLLFVDASTDFVGVGTSAPDARLHVVSSGADLFNVGSTAALSLFRVRSTGTIVNDQGAALDFRVEGDTDASALFVEGATDRVGVGTSSPSSKLSVGATSQFQVGTDGDLDRIKDVPYSWPAANAAGALNNDGAGNLSWAAPAPAAHNLLSASHGDTVTNTVTRGSLVYGNTTPAWDELVIGGANTILGSDGTDVAWRAQSFIDHGALTGLADDDHTQYALLAGRAGGQNLNGGTAVTDHLDLDPSSAANFTTGAVRIAPGAGDYGTGGALAIDLWPNGLTHGNGAAATRISGVRMTSTLTFDAAAATLPIFQFFRDSHVCVNSDVGVDAMPVNQSFLSNPTLRNAFAVTTSGPSYVGYSAGPLWSITGGGAIEATAVCFRSNPSTIPAGVTFNTGFTHFIATDMTVNGTINTEHVGYDCTVASGTTPVSYRSTAAAAQMRHAGPAAFGVNAAPATTVDILGDLATRVESRALVNGANNDVDAADISFLRITGPTLAFSVSGFTDGQDGKYLVVRNTTALAMTIVNNATSTAANQILTQTGANVVMTGTGSAWFIYDSTSARWILLAVRHSLGEGV